MFSEEDLVKRHKRRADQLGQLILILFALVLARLWYLQIYKGDLLYRYSLENQLRKEIVTAPRGMIFTRNNELIVENVPRFDAVVTPQYLKNSKETFQKLGTILSMTPSDVEDIVVKKGSRQARYRPIIVKKNISRAEVAVIETENFKLPGVSVQTFISREYRDKDAGSHLMGYISEVTKTQLPKLTKRDGIEYRLGDTIGQSGLEEQYDKEIRGDNGYEFMEVDARGRMKRHFRDDLFEEIQNHPATAGYNLRLTIDGDLQRVAYRALEGKTGAAVAIDVNTGDILAMVSRPSFDPSQFSRGLTPEYWKSLIENDDNPLRDRSIQEHYSPGSTYKTITAIAALEEGLVDENSEISCGGSFVFGRRAYHCWKKEGHGSVNIYKAIKESCDVYFYRIGTRLDIDVLANYSKMLGLGRKSGILLPREIPGLIPTKDWKIRRNGEEWQKGETLSCAIGQSYVLLTPLQLAMAYATIANGGNLYKPRLIKEVFSNTGDIIKKGEEIKFEHVKISEKTLSIVRTGLYKVVNEQGGTAFSHRGKGIEMAGKTGTSQVIGFTADKIFSKCENADYRHRHHALFVAYAPESDPKIAVAALVEHGCHGSAVAPVVQEIISTYMKKYWPLKYEEILEKEKKPHEKISNR